MGLLLHGRAPLLAVVAVLLIAVGPCARASELLGESLREAARHRYTEDINTPDDSDSSLRFRDYGPHSDLFMLTREDFKRLKLAMRNIPIKNSPLEVIQILADRLDRNPDYPWEELASGYLEQDLMEGLLSDAVLRRQLLDYTPSRQSSGGSEVVTEADDSDPPAPEDRDQTMGWEGCYADYDSYIGPFTDQYRYRLQLRTRDLRGVPIIVDPPLEQEPWHRRLLDANGKRPTGLTQGRKHWVGAAEVCADIVIRHNATINSTGMMEERLFKGMYARLDMPLDLSELVNISFAFPFQLGVCVPDTCNGDDIRRYIMEVNPQLMALFTGTIAPTTRNVTNVYLGSTAHFSTDPAAKTAIAIGIIGIVLLIIGSCYDGWGRRQIIRKKIKKYVTGSTKGKHDPLTVAEIRQAKNYLYEKPTLKDKLELEIAALSFLTSFKRLLGAERQHRAFHVPALDGLRVLMIMWIIKGMTYVYGIVYFECWTTDNLITALLEYTKEWSFMTILATPLANSGLFFISGFVCVQMWYKHYDRNGRKLNVGFCIRYVVLRYFSLMPVTVGMMMFYTCLYQYTEGPLNPIKIQDATNCRSTWWTVLILMHNVVKTDQQCMSWTWMVAAVFQLNIATLIVVLIPLMIVPVAAYIMMCAMYISYLVITIIWHQKVNDGELSWYYDIVQTPWCNAGPYVIGMALAIIMRDHEANWKTACRRAWVFFLWVIAVAFVCIVIYAPWDKFKGDGVVNDWPERGQLVFDVLAPQVLALALAWIVYACHYGYGGVVASLLQWRAFTALAKVCLPAVSFMGPTMTGHIYSRYTTVYIHENHMGNLYFGHLINVFYFGVLAAIIFHYPIARNFKKQTESVTRLELFLYSRHPAILDRFVGTEHEDREAWRELEEDAFEDEKPHIHVTGGGHGSLDVMRGKEPIGGYIPHQEVDGVPSLGDSIVKVPLSNSAKVVVTATEPRYDGVNGGGVVNRAYERENSLPPAYEATEMVVSSREVDDSFVTTAF